MKAISLDLRSRVCDAVAHGLSCRQAAARFEVSISSAIRWCARRRQTGSFAPQKQGGDRRSGRIEAEADFILAALEDQRDITLAELRARLAARGTHVGLATLHRFFARRGITLKKRPRTPPSRTGRTFRPGAMPGAECLQI